MSTASEKNWADFITSPLLNVVGWFWFRPPRLRAQASTRRFVKDQLGSCVLGYRNIVDQHLGNARVAEQAGAACQIAHFVDRFDRPFLGLGSATLPGFAF